MGAGARTKNFEDEPGAVDDFGLPAPLQIALLHRRQRAVDDDKADLALRDFRAEGINAAAADQGARRGPVEADNLAADDIEIDRAGKADRLVETGIKRARGTVGRPAAGRDLQGGMNDEGAARRRQTVGGQARSGLTVLSAAQG